MKFYFIAVNYNGYNFTKEYIKSISSIKLDIDDRIEIIIIDNDSSIDDKSKLKLLGKEYDNVKIIWSQKNVGYFKGLNIGIDKIDKNKDSLLIIGNNDLTFDKNFLVNLKKINYTNDTFVIAPNIITKDGRQQNPHVVTKVSEIQKFKAAVYNSNYYIGQVFRFLNQNIKRLLNSKVVLSNNYGQMKIKRGIGACYVLTPNFFKYNSRLDDRVFMWGEEALLSNQVESTGGITIYDPTIKIIHHESASVKSIETKKRYYMVKESYKIYKKYL